MAMAVDSRLWLGGVISLTRDLPLIARLVACVRASVVSLNVLVCVDGLASYVTAFRGPFARKYRARGGVGAADRRSPPACSSAK